jgi:hypothetical protein
MLLPIVLIALFIGLSYRDTLPFQARQRTGPAFAFGVAAETSFLGRPLSLFSCSPIFATQPLRAWVALGEDCIKLAISNPLNSNNPKTTYIHLRMVAIKSDLAPKHNVIGIIKQQIAIHKDAQV